MIVFVGVDCIGCRLLWFVVVGIVVVLLCVLCMRGSC